MDLPVFHCPNEESLLLPETYLREQMEAGVPHPACKIEGAAFDELANLVGRPEDHEFSVRAHILEADLAQPVQHPLLATMSRIALVGFAEPSLEAGPPHAVLLSPSSVGEHKDPFFSNIVNLTVYGERVTTVIDPSTGNSYRRPLNPGCLSVIRSYLNPYFPQSYPHSVEAASGGLVAQVKHTFKGRDMRSANVA